MINYKEDPLLNSIKEKNIYACLVKSQKDFKDITFTLRTPNIEILNKEKIIKLTIEKFTDFVKDNAIYELPWQPLNNNEIKILIKEGDYDFY